MLMRRVDAILPRCLTVRRVAIALFFPPSRPACRHANSMVADLLRPYMREGDECIIYVRGITKARARDPIVIGRMDGCVPPLIRCVRFGICRKRENGFST